MVNEAVQTIPEYLIYEMDEGQPIYYRGYKEVMNGEKTPEEIMGSGYLQAMLVEIIKKALEAQLGQDFFPLAQELGVQFKKKSWRNVDLAFYKKADLLKIEKAQENKYMNFPPEIVVEVDTKASFDTLPFGQDYYQRKTEQLLKFGVQQVIWLFTGTEKYLFAEAGKTWLLGDWTEDIQVRENITVNVQQLLDDFKNA